MGLAIKAVLWWFGTAVWAHDCHKLWFQYQAWV